MIYLSTIIVGVLVLIAVSVLWASGIDEMKQKHPTYHGEDWMKDWKDKDDDANQTENE